MANEEISHIDILLDGNVWIAFFSPLIMVLGIQAARFVPYVNGFVEDKGKYKYLKDCQFYIVMLAAGFISALMIYLYISGGVRFTPLLTLNLCLTNNFMIKKVIEGADKVQSSSRRVEE